MLSTVAVIVFSGLLLFAGMGCPALDPNGKVLMAKGMFDGCAGCAPVPGGEKTILLPGEVPLRLVWVPAGSFMMGRYDGEQDSFVVEDPRHEVTLASGFWMGKYPVTQLQWLALRNTWPGTAPSVAGGQGANHPAYYISWNDARQFIDALNAHIDGSGQGPLTVRLPSEAEWEYACRAGTQTRFYWGDDPNYTDIQEYAWFSGNNTPPGTKPTGQKLPNAFGLYDMVGNVMEWCEDDLHNNYIGAPATGDAWVDTPRSMNRMIRGGSYKASGQYCRIAYRVYGEVGLRLDNLGFRIAAQ